ncbi:hypothetical protein QF002_006467 [Paraburkholderia youngii]
MPTTRTPSGANGRRARLDAGLGQRAQHVVAARLDRIRAQIQRRRVVQRGGQLREFRTLETRAQSLADPVGQIQANPQRQAFRIDLRHVFEPRRLGLADERLQRRASDRLHQAQQGHAARRAAGAAFGQMRELHPAAQHGEHRLGDHTALGVAELRMRAEEAARGGVCGAVQPQYFGQQRFSLSNQETMQSHAPSPAV